GLQFLHQQPCWVRDDAINADDELDPQKFKVVVTGEPVMIRRMHQASVSHRFNIPVILTTNALPESNDASDAVANRAIIMSFNRVVTEAEAALTRKRLKIPWGVDYGDFIYQKEASGILNWALACLLNLMDRGEFIIPDSVKNASR